MSNDQQLKSPSPDYGPEEVIEVQLDAMKDNDTPFDDSGIKTAFNFASEKNKRSTGPLPRFKKMVHSKRYSMLLNHDRAKFGDIENDGNLAKQIIDVYKDGERVRFRFEVELQEEDENEGCWTTNSVLRI
jgi:hypothetical protein